MKVKNNMFLEKTMFSKSGQNFFFLAASVLVNHHHPHCLSKLLAELSLTGELSFFLFSSIITEFGKKIKRGERAAHKSNWLVAERPCRLHSATILASIYSVAALPAIVCQENPGPPGCSLMSCLSYLA